MPVAHSNPHEPQPVQSTKQLSWTPRYQRQKVCSECESHCADNRCRQVKTPTLRDYGGIRHTADGFDCALPVTIDSHSHCSFGCLYCFSDNLSGHAAQAGKGIGQMSLSKLDAIFGGGGGKYGDLVRRALRYDRRNAAGFPCPVQLGGVNDPMDNIERNRGWFLEFCKLVAKHQQPVRVSTKGDLFLVPEYRDAVAPVAHLFWVAFSCISCDDELLVRIDKGAPNATRRLQAMHEAHKLGCKTSLRFRPMLPQVSDSTRRHPKAPEELLARAAEAGADAVSAEVAFYPGSGLGQGNQRAKFEELQRIIGVPLERVYRSFGRVSACTRPAASWTENVMHRMAEVAHEHGLVVGVSDPVWKQLNDTGCCCGILPTDPVFGNWEVENATNALVTARDNPGHVIRERDIIPPWAYDMKKGQMCAMGAGPTIVWHKRHATWADNLEDLFRSTSKERSVYKYFQGALEPVVLPDGEIGYTYKGLERVYPKNTPFWKVNFD